MPRQMSADQITDGRLQGGVRQLSGMLAKDPILRATEAALNANPLRKVIPVDWAEIVRALRTALPASCRGAPTPRSGSAESHPMQAEPRIIVPVGTPAGPPLRCGPRPVQRTAG